MVKKTPSSVFPLFLHLEGKKVLVAGGDGIAQSKIPALLNAGAKVVAIAETMNITLRHPNLQTIERRFRPSDLKGIWYVVAASSPSTNAYVAAEAGRHQIFVNAVDDLQNATAYLGSVIERDGYTIAISSGGQSPAITKLLRQGLEWFLPMDLSLWTSMAKSLRLKWTRQATPHPKRVPELLQSLNEYYERESVQEKAS